MGIYSVYISCIFSSPSCQPFDGVESVLFHLILNSNRPATFSLTYWNVLTFWRRWMERMLTQVWHGWWNHNYSFFFNFFCVSMEGMSWRFYHKIHNVYCFLCTHVWIIGWRFITFVSVLLVLWSISYLYILRIYLTQQFISSVKA